MLTFKSTYFILTILLFTVEVLIATFVHDQIIRPYIGDLLVVILIYCFVKSFFNFPIVSTAISILLFSFLVEFLQYLKIVEVFGLQKNKIARIIIGTSFSWFDLVLYTIGISIVILVEKFIAKKAE